MNWELLLISMQIHQSALRMLFIHGLRIMHIDMDLLKDILLKRQKLQELTMNHGIIGMWGWKLLKKYRKEEYVWKNILIY